MSNSEDPKVEVALTKCFYCLKEDRIVMNKTVTKTWADRVSAAHGTVIDGEPCSKCEEAMKKGVIIIVIDLDKCEKDWNDPKDRKNWLPNPYRSGGWYVMVDEGVKKIVKDSETLKKVLETRFMFIPVAAEKALGLEMLYQDLKDEK